ncbi:MAG: exosortase [Phycisphaerales bacterium]|nr:exosortase [Phycisphaerales bacterium]
MSTPDPRQPGTRNSPLILGLVTPAGAVMSGFLAIAFIAVFYRWIWTQHLISAGSLQDWGHAYAIPFISLYLLWQNREEFAKVRKAAFWPGLAPLLLGIVAYFFCIVGIKNHMLQGFSMILTLFGVALLMLGPAAMRFLFLPIAYLAFAVTISEIIMIRVTFQMKLLAAQGAWFLLSIAGAVLDFQTDLRGNVLEIVTSQGKIIPLDVAEACSGVRMVIAFVALGAAVALISCREWWQRAALLVMAVPVALLMNIIRVALLGVLSLIDPGLAEGDAHMLIGTLLLIPGLGLFMAVVWSLNRMMGPAGPAPGAKP